MILRRNGFYNEVENAAGYDFINGWSALNFASANPGLDPSPLQTSKVMKDLLNQ